MELHEVKPGDTVLIDATKEPDWGFVDGWRGKVTGHNSGLVVVECERVDGLKTFYVPPRLLTLSV